MIRSGPRGPLVVGLLWLQGSTVSCATLALGVWARELILLDAATSGTLGVWRGWEVHLGAGGRYVNAYVYLLSCNLRLVYTLLSAYTSQLKNKQICSPD